jgi:hypothetical protein
LTFLGRASRTHQVVSGSGSVNTIKALNYKAMSHIRSLILNIFSRSNRVLHHNSNWQSLFPCRSWLSDWKRKLLVLCRNNAHSLRRDTGQCHGSYEWPWVQCSDCGRREITIPPQEGHHQPEQVLKVAKCHMGGQLIAFLVFAK